MKVGERSSLGLGNVFECASKVKIVSILLPQKLDLQFSSSLSIEMLVDDLKRHTHWYLLPIRCLIAGRLTSGHLVKVSVTFICCGFYGYKRFGDSGELG